MSLGPHHSGEQHCQLCDSLFQGKAQFKYCSDCRSRYSTRKLTILWKIKHGRLKAIPQLTARDDTREWFRANVHKGWHFCFVYSSLPMQLCRSYFLAEGGRF
jgi:hypothetical protein